MRPCDVFVIFGITGDLAKVMTFHSLYRLEQRGLLDCPIVGVAVDDWSDEDLREHAREAIEASSGEKLDPKVFNRLVKRFSYVQGDFADDETYERLARQIKDAKSPVFYLEIPPSLFGMVVKGLAGAKLTARRRDRRREALRPRPRLRPRARRGDPSVHRRGHSSTGSTTSSAKMGLAEILYLRFANAMFEPVWNRNHVACVQITMAEDFGVADRGQLLRPGWRASRRGRQPPDAGGCGGRDGATRPAAPRAR